MAVLGFSYKKNTSDTRDTASVAVISDLVTAGLHVKVSDPQVTANGFKVEFEAQGYAKMVSNIETNVIDDQQDENSDQENCQ